MTEKCRMKTLIQMRRKTVTKSMSAGQSATKWLCIPEKPNVKIRSANVIRFLPEVRPIVWIANTVTHCVKMCV